MCYTVTMDHFQYLFGEWQFRDEEKRDLKKFFEFVKAKIEMNTLVEAHTLSDNLGMKNNRI